MTSVPADAATGDQPRPERRVGCSPGLGALREVNGGRPSEHAQQRGDEAPEGHDRECGVRAGYVRGDAGREVTAPRCACGATRGRTWCRSSSFRRKSARSLSRP